MDLDVTELADHVTGKRTGCWRRNLEGDALKLVKLVEARTENPSRTLLARALEQVGTNLSRRVISAHYSGECSCRVR